MMSIVIFSCLLLLTLQLRSNQRIVASVILLLCSFPAYIANSLILSRKGDLCKVMSIANLVSSRLTANTLDYGVNIGPGKPYYFIYQLLRLYPWIENTSYALLTLLAIANVIVISTAIIILLRLQKESHSNSYALPALYCAFLFSPSTLSLLSTPRTCLSLALLSIVILLKLPTRRSVAFPGANILKTTVAMICALIAVIVHPTSAFGLYILIMSYATLIIVRKYGQRRKALVANLGISSLLVLSYSTIGSRILMFTRTNDSADALDLSLGGYMFPAKVLLLVFVAYYSWKIYQDISRVSYSYTLSPLITYSLLSLLPWSLLLVISNGFERNTYVFTLICCLYSIVRFKQETQSRITIKIYVILSMFSLLLLAREVDSSKSDNMAVCSGYENRLVAPLDMHYSYGVIDELSSFYAKSRF